MPAGSSCGLNFAVNGPSSSLSNRRMRRRVMWLNHNGSNEQIPWISVASQCPIPAAYRRGIFRAKVNAHELTCTHAQIECLENPPAGTMVWLTFAGLEARAAVVEDSAAFRIRLRFVEPFHPAVLDAILIGSLRRFH